MPPVSTSAVATDNPGGAPHCAPCDALWNPGAAASWSLLFTPLFGAYIHMHNWRVLGEDRLAAQARRWVHAAVAMLGLQIFTAALNARLNAEALLLHPAGLLFMLLWYVSAARAQVALVKARYGTAYPRRAWDPVVLAALAGAVIYAALKALAAWLFLSLT